MKNLTNRLCKCQTAYCITNTTTLAVMLVEEMGSHPTAECDQGVDQHEEELLDCCGCVWLLHMLLRPLFVNE